MGSKVNKDVVAKVNAIYRFDLSANGATRSWLVDLKNGAGKVSEVTGKDVEGECTIGMTETDFLALMDGKLDGQSAFLGGQLKVTSLPVLDYHHHQHHHHHHHQHHDHDHDRHHHNNYHRHQNHHPTHACAPLAACVALVFCPV